LRSSSKIREQIGELVRRGLVGRRERYLFGIPFVLRGKWLGRKLRAEFRRCGHPLSKRAKAEKLSGGALRIVDGKEEYLVRDGAVFKIKDLGKRTLLTPREGPELLKWIESNYEEFSRSEYAKALHEIHDRFIKRLTQVWKDHPSLMDFTEKYLDFESWLKEEHFGVRPAPQPPPEPAPRKAYREIHRITNMIRAGDLRWFKKLLGLKIPNLETWKKLDLLEKKLEMESARFFDFPGMSEPEMKLWEIQKVKAKREVLRDLGFEKPNEPDSMILNESELKRKIKRIAPAVFLEHIGKCKDNPIKRQQLWHLWELKYGVEE
jgi:hypothetical protein